MIYIIDKMITNNFWITQCPQLFFTLKINDYSIYNVRD